MSDNELMSITDALKEAILKDTEEIRKKSSSRWIIQKPLDGENDVGVQYEHIQPILKKLENLAEEGFLIDATDGEMLLYYALHCKNPKEQKTYLELVKAQCESVHKEIAAKATYNLGNIEAMNKRYEAALSYYQQAESLAPWLQMIYYNRACCLSELGQFEEAFNSFKVIFDLLEIEHQPESISNLLEIILKDNTLKPLIEDPKKKKYIIERLQTLIPNKFENTSFEKVHIIMKKIFLNGTLLAVVASSLFTSFKCLNNQKDCLSTKNSSPVYLSLAYAGDR